MEWKEYQIQDVCRLINGRAYSNDEMLEHGKYKIVRVGNLSGGNSTWFYSDLELPADKYCHNGDLLFAWACTFGPHIWKEDNTIFHYHIWKIVEDKDVVDRRFFYYYLKFATGGFLGALNGSVMVHITKSSMEKMIIRIPKKLEDQRRIASILSSLDRKIELNNKINADLEEMAQAIFKNWFVDFEPFKDGKFVDSELGMIPEGWKVGRADDFYQINIGKTPPGKEHIWFSTNPADKIWVSIANMGNSGIFISDSSEYLTKEAVDRHNIIMVPRNTILLSFKLTVGRVAIADKELTTNEAIARFILSDDKYMEYLYLYLKKYDYNSLGSTSSIATAVNSKTIKGMQMLQPSDKIIDAFHIQVNPIFEKIRSLTKENSRLSLLRDTLLPRLMSGELEVPE